MQVKTNETYTRIYYRMRPHTQRHTQQTHIRKQQVVMAISRKVITRSGCHRGCGGCRCGGYYNGNEHQNGGVSGDVSGAAIHYITFRYVTVHYITLHYITLHYITLHYITYIPTYIHTYIYELIHYSILYYISSHYITSHYII